jgi:hypothetical protein
MIKRRVMKIIQVRIKINPIRLFFARREKICKEGSERLDRSGKE